MIDFRGSGEALGDHLRPPLGDLGDTLGAGGGHSGSLWEHWSHFQRTLGPLCGLWGEISGSEASCIPLFCKICRFFQGICTLFCTWVEQNRIVFGKLSSFQRASRSLAKTGFPVDAIYFLLSVSLLPAPRSSRWRLVSSRLSLGRRCR